ncbi:MAG: 16S rRNA (cytosine(1402)-N(4))-methyltransferase RsmH [Alphaproteobacteria bacterium]|nr:16S rRNA (cytosine(1402)-N(4))-methyltransferase RsmH [Alphaproteobacteria bacterium]
MAAAVSRRRSNPTGAGAEAVPANGHTPVLLDSVIAALEPRTGAVYIDGTLGAGGYTSALLEATDCIVWAIDRDPDAIARNSELAATYGGRLHLISGHFGDMQTLLADRGVSAVDGVTLDLGVSSMQIDDPARGFAFSQDGPLDMRMDQAGPSAADLVNTVDESELADIIHGYGEERLARRIARAIVAARAEAPIETTGRLADIVRAVATPRKRSRKGRENKIDPATRTFQALRIKVNDELAELERGLGAAEAILKPGGRLAIVSFHSLEDRRVKVFLRQRSGNEGRGSRHRPEVTARHAPAWRLLGRRAIRPSDAEMARNPRARSARLRVAERTDAPSWGPIGEETAA